MDSQLSEEQMNKLLPSLKRLADLISAGETLDQRTLRSITSEIGVDGKEWALVELELWVQILIKCKDPSYPEETIVTTLQGRGIPKASAELAVYLAKPKPLTIEPKFVDLGCLKFGEGASTTLQASGEPIVKIVGGSRLKITLLKSGPAKTLVKLQLSSGASSEPLKEEIILRGNTGEVRVTVTARWEEERPRLSYCPVCKISKKSLWWNYRDKKYECLNLECKATGPDLDKLVSSYKRR